MEEEIECSLPEGWQSVILDGDSNIRSTQFRTHLKRIAKTRNISNSHPVLFSVYFQKGCKKLIIFISRLLRLILFLSLSFMNTLSI